MSEERILGRFKAWRESALLFAKEVIGVEPSAQQAELLSGIFKGGEKRHSVRSGHGTGKDAAASWAIWCFLSTRVNARVACTAPTGHQLRDVLWSELAKWYWKCPVLQDEFVMQKDKIFHRSAPDTWWCRAITVNVKASADEQAETLQGLHNEHLFLVVDEASGVPDPVFVPLEGAMTQEDNRVLLIGNPTRSSGYFYDTHFHKKLSGKWRKYHWDSRKSSNVSQEMVDYFADKYGEDSNVFQIRVAGNPPVEEEGVLIPLGWSRQCIGNEVSVGEEDPVYLGVDVARYGGDASVVLPRQGLKVFPWETFKGMNTIELADRIVDTFLAVDGKGVGIDGIGIGGGVCDYLYRHKGGRGFVTEVNVYNASTNKVRYRRLRDELWVRVREKCMKGLYSFPDQYVKYGGMDLHLGEWLCDELATPRYSLDSGMWQIESKKDMKQRGIGSPNVADALCITEYFYEVAPRLWGGKGEKGKKKRRFYGEKNRIERGSWMAV